MINLLFGHWQMTLLGCVGAIGTYLATQPGSGCQLLAIIIPLVIGAIAKNPTTAEVK